MSGRRDKERGSYLAEQSHVNSQRKTFRGNDKTALDSADSNDVYKCIIKSYSPKAVYSAADLKFIRRRNNACAGEGGGVAPLAQSPRTDVFGSAYVQQ